MTLLRSPKRSPIRSPRYSPLVGKYGAAFTPLDLFADGKKGAWWSFRTGSDGSGMAQVNDLSPNANHILQASADNQPTYTVTDGIGGAVFDGVNDHMQLASSATLDIGSVSKLTMIVAMRQTNSADTGIICETGLQTTDPRGAGININNGGTGTFGAGIGMTGAYNLRNLDGAGAVPRSYVASVTFDTAQARATEMTFRVDGISQPSVQVLAAGTVSGDIQSAAAFIVGGRTTGNSYLASTLHDLIIIPGEVDADDLANIEAYLFNVCGF